MATGFIVLGHGSKVSETVEILKGIKGSLETRMQSDNVRYAALQFNEPSLPEAIARFVDDGFTEIVILPLFLVDGNHIRQDIPEIINEELKRFPSLTITVADHIGADMRVTDILLDRAIGIAPLDRNGDGLRRIQEPALIEEESFRIIEAAVNLRDFTSEERAVVKRIVHASGDLSLAGAVDISHGAIAAGIAALRDGCPIITDVRMVATGISKKLVHVNNNSILCKVDDSAVESEAKRLGTTRSAVAIRSLTDHIDNAIVAIGNAPTALFELLDMVKDGACKPALVVGTPVGFVGAAESKEALTKSGINYITVRGTRGGSAIAAAATNAILKMACDENGK